jgi:tripartite-type tricarboxylate transporter receptor subunit TctC
MHYAMSTRSKFLTALALVAQACPFVATAQPYPSRAVRVIVPFPAGGGTDVIARTLGEGLAKELGQAFVVDNKPGGGTVVGNDAVAKSPADGYTLLLTTSAFSIVPSLVAKMPYAGESAFAPVALIGRAPNMVVVKNDSPFKTAKDMLAYAKAHPGKLTYGSAGNGTSVHLAAELLKNSARIFITHVPYRGASPQITDLLGGQIDLAFATVPSVAPFLAGGKMRALAVTSAARSPSWPNVPTIAESGVPGYHADVWYGVFAPAGTPPAIVAQLNAAFKRAAQSETFRQRVEREGLVTAVGTPEELSRLAKAEEARWKKVVKEQNITAE